MASWEVGRRRISQNSPKINTDRLQVPEPSRLLIYEAGSQGFRERYYDRMLSGGCATGFGFRVRFYSAEHLPVGILRRSVR